MATIGVSIRPCTSLHHNRSPTAIPIHRQGHPRPGRRRSFCHPRKKEKSISLLRHRSPSDTLSIYRPQTNIASRLQTANIHLQWRHLPVRKIRIGRLRECRHGSQRMASAKNGRRRVGILNVHGALFLDIGRSGGQRNIGFVPQTLVPQVSREYVANGVLWDQAKERDDRRKLRKLVKDILTTGGASTPASTTTNLPPHPSRRESSQYLASAGTDISNVENSPDLARPNGGAFAGATPGNSAGGAGDESPRSVPSRPLSTQHPHPRAHTYDSSMNEHSRDMFSKEMLASVRDIPRKASPSAISETGLSNGRTFPGFSAAESGDR